MSIIKYILQLIPHKCHLKYKGTADAGLMGIVGIWECWCGKGEIRY